MPRSATPKRYEDPRVGKTRWERVRSPSERVDFIDLAQTEEDYIKRSLVTLYARTPDALSRQQRAYRAADEGATRMLELAGVSRMNDWYRVMRAGLIKGFRDWLVWWTGERHAGNASAAKREMTKRDEPSLFDLIDATPEIAASEPAFATTPPRIDEPEREHIARMIRKQVGLE